MNSPRRKHLQSKCNEFQSPKSKPSLSAKSPNHIPLKSTIKRNNKDKDPLKTQDRSESALSYADRQQLFLQEIKELKRQNLHLKKQLSSTIRSEQTIASKSPKKLQESKVSVSNLEKMPLSINIFFQQIHELLTTIVSVLKLEISNRDQLRKYEQKYSNQSVSTCPMQKFQFFRKYELQQQLEKIMQAEKQERYPLCLDTFITYYTAKQKNDEKIVKAIDQMTARAYELNQIANKTFENKKCKSTMNIRPEQTSRENPLKVSASPAAKNFVQRNKMTAFSPGGNRNKKQVKYVMSPAIKIDKQ